MGQEQTSHNVLPSFLSAFDLMTVLGMNKWKIRSFKEKETETEMER